jgi:hypothetical protein
MNLNTNLSKLASPKPKCPKCKKETEINNLYVKIQEIGDSKNYIFCNKCVDSVCNNQNNTNNDNNSQFNIKIQYNSQNEKIKNNSFINFENLALNDFLETLKYELDLVSKGNLKIIESLNVQNNINNSFNKKAEETLDMKIMNFVDVYFEKLKRNLKLKIKQFMLNYLFEELEFNFEMERNVNNFNSDLIKKISTLIIEVKSIFQINESNIPKINQAIFVYLRLNSMEFDIERLMNAKNFINYLSFNFAFSSNEKFEDLIVNNLELKQNKELFFSNVENYAMKNSSKEFDSGIQLIDNEFLKLKKNLNNYIECFADYGSLSQKNDELIKQLDIQENKYSTLTNNFADILNENVEFSEANKKFEQQLADLLVKSQSNKNKQVKELEAKLQESQVSLNEQEKFVAEIKEQLNKCCEELEITKREKHMLHQENQKLKNQKLTVKANFNTNNNKLEKLKLDRSCEIFVEDDNNDFYYDKNRMKEVEALSHLLNDPKKTESYEDINSSVLVDGNFDYELKRTSKLHMPAINGKNDFRSNLKNQTTADLSTPITDLGENK